MKNTFRTGLLMTAIALTAACNGGGNGVIVDRPDVADVNERLDREVAMRDRIEGYAGTSFDAIPDVGDATFNGMGTATVDRNGGGRGDDINLVGFVRMTADFRRGTMDGSMTNIQGYTGSRPRAGNVFDANGQIRIGERDSDLEFSRNGATNRWTTDYRGNLDTPEGRIVMDGELAGLFRGTRPNATGSESSIRALMGSDSDGTALVDGREAEGLEFNVMGLN